MRQAAKMALFLTIMFVTAAIADDKINASDRYVYVGAQFGLSEPLVKSFKHKDSNTLIRLKQSHMYGARVGYSFYPNMRLEFSGTYQPKHRLAYRLPEVSTPFGMIPSTQGITRVTSNIFMVNVIYEVPKMTFLEIKPYALFGAGVARISVKPTISYWAAPAPVAFVFGADNVPFFKVKKSNKDCFTWQVGAGIGKDLTDNFTIDFGAKMQVIRDVQVKYQTLEIKTRSFVNQKPIKKTIGVGEFTMGLTYKIPLNY